MKLKLTALLCLWMVGLGAMAQESPWYDGEPYVQTQYDYDIKSMPQITVSGNKFVQKLAKLLQIPESRHIFASSKGDIRQKQ